MEPATRLLRRMAVALTLAVTSVVLTLGVLEVGLRLTTPSQSPQQGVPAGRPPGDELKTVAQFATPNVRGHMASGASYRANASGFRGPDYTRPKPPGVFRIAVIGDSVAMGAGVGEEDTYAARIERALNADPPRPVVYEVLNLGLAGSNAPGVVARLRSVGLPYEPDLILYGYTLNDIEGPAYRLSRDLTDRTMGNLAREQWARDRLYVSTFFRTRFYSLRELFWPPKGSLVRELDDNYFHNPPAVAALDSAFGQLERIARERRVCVLVMQHPALWFLHAFHPFRRHHAVVAGLVTAHGFVNKDTVDYFLGHDGLSLWVSAFDPHPNAEGHALLARAALDALRALPARCWDGDPGNRVRFTVHAGF